jgi:DNA-binding response OmpR family regulator
MTTKPKLLIVDDELLIRDLLYDYFKSRDYDIAVAESAQGALAQIEDSHFDTITLDLKMPDMDGLELATKIRATDVNVPIIVMTGYPSMETAIEAIRRRADDYFIKPFNLKQMNKAVESALTRAGCPVPAASPEATL